MGLNGFWFGHGCLAVVVVGFVCGGGGGFYGFYSWW